MTINASVQFDSFLDFAQKSMEAGSSKAVARADAVVPGTNGGYATRTIVAAPDKAFKLSRSITDKAKNDIARTLFQKSVIDMFGGEDKIPESVKEAMLLKDYGEGKPLTARRIMAVKQAIDHFLARTAVTDGIQRVNEFQRARQGTMKAFPAIVLTDEQISMATDLVEKYGKGLSEKGIKLLSNFTVTLFACLFELGLFSDVRLHTSGNVLVVEVQERPTVASIDFAGNKEFNDEGLHISFCKDASRASFVINGQDLSHGTCTGDDIMRAFTQAVRREHRRALSSFFSQTTGGAMIGLSQRCALFPTVGIPQGIDLSKVKGSQMIISSAFGYEDPFYKIPKTQHSDSIYTLDVAADGRSAKVTVETKGDIYYAMESSSNVVGSFAWKQEYVFDLTGVQPRIVSANVGQTFEA